MDFTDDQVAEIAGMTAGTSLGVRARQLACEVQAFRRDEPLVIAMGQRIERFEKLIADLRALQPKGTRGSLHYGGSNQALLAVRRLIDGAGL